MAIFRFEAKIIGRSDRKGGRSIVACAAYRAACKLSDKKYGKDHDYRARARELDYSGIHAGPDAPAWLRYTTRRGECQARAALWNDIEALEDGHNRRANAQLARELIAACPVELNKEQRRRLVIGFTEAELVSRGMVCDVALHRSWNAKNPHAHILCSLRGLSDGQFSPKKVREWNDKALLLALREAWERHCNAALEAVGSAARVDRRSLADRGIAQDPEPKTGVAAAAMARRGIDTEAARRTRWARMENASRAVASHMGRGGETFFRFEPGANGREKLHNGVQRRQEAAENLRDDTASGRPAWARSAWAHSLREQRRAEESPAESR